MSAILASDCARSEGKASSASHLEGVIFILNLCFHWPTAITLAWVITDLLASLFAVSRAANEQTCLDKILHACLFEMVLRITRLCAVFMHELAHLLAGCAILLMQLFRRIVVLRDDPPIQLINTNALFARISLEFPQGLGMGTWIARQLIPGTFSPAARIVLPDWQISPWMEFIIRQAGFVASIVAPFLAPMPCETSHITGPCYLGLILGACGAILSDGIGGPLSGVPQPAGCFCCGNWGLLVPREALGSRKDATLFPSVCMKLLTAVLEIVELRGAQAGGLLTFLSESGNVVPIRSRVVKSKRGLLSQMLFHKFRRALWLRSFAAGLKLKRLRSLPIVLAQGHTRFGTSSASAEIETHPHQWLGPHRESVWQFDLRSGRWRRDVLDVCVTITHNGDFDGWRVHKQFVPNGLLGEWLARVFHVRNLATGDSAKLAGVMDLLACQGQWVAAVRQVFSLWVMTHPDEACNWERLGPEAPNAVPRRKIFAAWAGAFDSAFEQEVTLCPDFEPTTRKIRQLAKKVSDIFENMIEAFDEQEGNIRLGLNRRDHSQAVDLMLQWFPNLSARSSFCQKVCEAFFKFDLLSVVWYFFSRAEGTFAISVSSTLHPDQIILAALGQPVSLAFDTERPLVVWSSEPASLSTPWPSEGSARLKRIAQARWDFKDATGEALEIRMVREDDACDQVNALNSRLSCTIRSETRYFVVPDPPGFRVDERCPYKILVRGTSLAQKQSYTLLPRQFASRLVRYRGPVAKPAVGYRYGLDPVGADLQDVPAILHEIDDSWGDRGSLNRVSATKFSKCLSYLLAQSRNPGSDIDVLIFGVENSLWLGQQFAADLARVFPKLNITTMSSNWVLGMLQEGHGHITPSNWALSERRFTFSDHAIALAISQSGTTYPTVWATRILSRRQQPIHIFTMSADFDTVLANSVGQDLAQREFAGCLFSTLSRVRPCEPSTAATLAMHHTLTHLLCCCTSDVILNGSVRVRKDRAADCRTSSKVKQIPDCELQYCDVQDLQRLVASLVPSAVEMCGVTVGRKQLSSKVREDLLAMGGYLASHLVEGYVAMVIGFIYIYLTVTFGIPFFSGIWNHIVVPGVDLDRETLFPFLVALLVGHIDAHFYVFLAAILATAHRWLHGRRLWTRYTARTVVIVDSTANYKLLRAYLSKLRALAFPCTTFGVAGQNGQDHFVHEMTHLTTSEVILAVGRPDGRLASLAMAESACIMSTQQARFTASRPRFGVEAISVSHNPWAKPGLFSRAVSIPTTSRPEFLSCRMLRTSDGAHAPSDVVSMVAALTDTQHDHSNKLGSAQDFPWVDVDDLFQRMGRPADYFVSQERAELIINEIVEEQASKLGIGTMAFDAKELLDCYEQRRNNCKSPPTSPRGFQSIVPVSSGRSSIASRNRSSFFGSGPSMRSSTSVGRVTLMGGSGSFFRRNALGQPDGTFALSQIMSMLRGPEMQSQLAKLRRQLSAQRLLKEVLHDLCKNPDDKVLQKAFQEWVGYTVRLIKEKKEGPAAAVKLFSKKTAVTAAFHVAHMDRNQQPEDFPEAEWRTLDEIRRFNRRQQVILMQQFGEVCFETWKSIARGVRRRRRASVFDVYACSSKETTDALLSKASSSTSDDPREALPISSALMGKVHGKDLLAELSLVETLYETRIAAAERLLAFYVTFHRAVRSISRLPWRTFDMDRSESRLRVASTPAPVPFVEKLEGAQDPPAVAAARKIQRCIMKRHRFTSRRSSSRERSCAPNETRPPSKEKQIIREQGNTIIHSQKAEHRMATEVDESILGERPSSKDDSATHEKGIALTVDVHGAEPRNSTEGDASRLDKTILSKEKQLAHLEDKPIKLELYRAERKKSTDSNESIVTVPGHQSLGDQPCLLDDDSPLLMAHLPYEPEQCLD